jgi:hypothetical protein
MMDFIFDELAGFTKPLGVMLSDRDALVIYVFDTCLAYELFIS